jgi:hypothetical protein
MRAANEAEFADVPRWALWLVAVVCLGPLTLMWLLGILYLVLWVAILAPQLVQPEPLGVEPSEVIREIAWPIAQVIGGFIGLVGLVRVLTLSRRERPKSHRVFTIGMVVIGFLAVLSFHPPFVEGGLLPDVEEIISVAGIVFLVLPFTGAAWLLAKSWRFLLAGHDRRHVESRRSKIRQERRDDWRLDA